MLTCLKLWKIVKIFNRRQIILQSTKFFVTPQSLFLGYIKVFYKGLISSTDAVFSPCVSVYDSRWMTSTMTVL